ncbi:MAG: thioredoxin-dependent thiol peroxidase [Chitinophagaceae bacterium]
MAFPALHKRAPAFTLLNQHQTSVSLKDYLGKKVALFFYPEDDTPTCTQEACNLRDHYEILQHKGIILLGISPDEPQKHVKFIAKYKLPFDLLSDTDMKIMKKYDVWGEKKMYGHTFMGVKRTTFLINEEGKLDAIVQRVLSKIHHQQILKTWNME